jgi:TRAP-type uncharacterized transport system fused permease subunit
MTSAASALPARSVKPAGGEASGTKRKFLGIPATIIRWVTIAYAAFCFLYIGGVFQYLDMWWTATFPGSPISFFIFPLNYNASFLIFIMAFCFLYFPATKWAPKTRVPWYDWVLIALSILVNGYIIAVSLVLANSPHRLPNVFEQALAVISVIIILEGTRRTAGLGLAITGLLFFIYPFITEWMPAFLEGRNQSLPRVSEILYLFPGGIYGQLLDLMASLVAIFLIFGAFMVISGVGAFFVNFAYALMGRFRGGPAKVAVIAASLFGMINGSGAANVAAIGPITIPMIKKIGYSPTHAGAIVAVASNGGQIMPPVLGLAAFLMVEFLGVSYSTIALVALAPALLYYISAFVQIDLEAVRLGLKGLPKSEIPTFRQTFKEGWLSIFPIAVLVWLMVVGYTPVVACFVATVVLISVSWTKTDIRSAWPFLIPVAVLVILIQTEIAPPPVASIICLIMTAVISAIKKDLRFRWKKIQEGLYSGMQTIPDTGVTIVMAGILMGVLTLTGLGVRITGGLVAVAQGNLFVLLLLTAIAALVLGLALPTSTTYLLVAMLLAPALVKVGMAPIVAHFFCFYYGLAAMLSPPVCPPAFIAASIAGAPFMKTGWLSMRMGIVVFTVPFFFAYNPGLLLVGEPLAIVIAMVISLFFVTFLSASMEGSFLRVISWAERIMLGIAGLATIVPIWQVQVGAIVIGVLTILFQLRKRKTLSPPVPSG